MENTQGVIDAIKELSEDNTIPKNVRDKLNVIINHLSGKEDLSIRIDKALHDLEGISEDSNLQAYTRTQIWNIASMLEMIK